MRTLSLIILLLGIFALSACDDDPVDTCGDGIVDPGEDCDGEESVDIDCRDLSETEFGPVGCSDTCTYSTDQCYTCGTCGNGIICGTETCDGSNLGDATCESQGNYSGGTLSCTDLCTLDTSQCIPK